MRFSIKERYLNTQIEKDLEKKMVFLSGPRQSGKTTTAIGMYLIGDNSSHLSELKDFFWTPIPLGILSLIGAFKKKD